MHANSLLGDSPFWMIVHVKTVSISQKERTSVNMSIFALNH